MFTLISSTLAVIGHHLASEEPVSWRRAAAGAVVVLALSWCAARPCRPGWQVLSATGLAQLLLHQALSVPRLAGPQHAEAHGSVLGIGRTAHHGTWPMTAAHCVAACVMALLMHRADRALSRLPDTVGRWVQAAVAATVTAFGLRCRPGVRPALRTVPLALDGVAVRPAAATMLCHAVVRRGPPDGWAGDVPLILTGSSAAGRGPSRVPRGFSIMNTSRTPRRLRKLGLQVRRLCIAAVGAVVVVGVAAGPAAAHAEVTASDPRALAENVTLSFTSEAESDTAGIKELRVVLPKGIAPDALTLKDAPKDWKLTATADGYSIGGPALATGTDAEYSVTVRQLPDEKSLAFKTLETYGDGKIDRWIEVPANGEKVDNPAPVLELKAAAPGAKLIAPAPSPTPSSAAPSAPAAPAAAAAQPSAPAGSASARAASAEDAGSGAGAVAGVIAAVLLLVAGGTFWWVRRGRGNA
ncbi:hypothetical protein EES41_31445 [Streptomyces sp. ADI95-16]|uniref:DUF1775 domain-containing protein n=2 Tax=unclassified Streptomyces TaxID=2593676 RepID=UPI000F42F665|nr:DUF1775 domain-containing protein [Streptomyces sp. ADI95-16]AYV31253.1 hypothetical protein EES41_31445 [Streptomyces sp. ADI95-16]